MEIEFNVSLKTLKQIKHVDINTESAMVSIHAFKG